MHRKKVLIGTSLERTHFTNVFVGIGRQNDMQRDVLAMSESGSHFDKSCGVRSKKQSSDAWHVCDVHVVNLIEATPASNSLFAIVYLPRAPSGFLNMFLEVNNFPGHAWVNGRLRTARTKKHFQS